jgi:hypothetical protein
MSKFIVSVVVLASTLLSVVANAQDKKSLDSVDRVIMQQIIKPAEEKAGGQEPDWILIVQQIKASYSDVQTDRAITKAKIYYYYYKDWAQFSTAIVHYTDAYENKDDLKLMNTNAKFILEHSTNPSELRAALGWIKHATEKEPSNSEYQQTYQALQAKTSSH